MPVAFENQSFTLLRLKTYIHRKVRKRIGKSPVKHCSNVPSASISMTGLPFSNPIKCLFFPQTLAKLTFRKYSCLFYITHERTQVLRQNKTKPHDSACLTVR